MATLLEDQIANETFYEVLDQIGGDGPLSKEASDIVDDYVRLKLREDGYTRKWLPAQKITNDQLDRQYDTPLPVKIVDMEIDSPAAVSAPFRQTPSQCYIHGKRFRVTFSRILSPWFTADVNELRTHVMDIRQVMSDNALKDMLAEEDRVGLAGVQAIMGGTAGAVSPLTGVTQWMQVPSAISRVAWLAGIKQMTTMDGHLTPERALVNNYTVWDFAAWGRDEMGGDYSQDLVQKGLKVIKDFTGLELIVTIKRNLVGDGSVYFFGNPQFMGKFYELDDTVMFVERRAFMLSWFSYNCLGMTLCNPYAFTRVDYNEAA